MLRLLLCFCLISAISAGWMLATLPATQSQSPAAMELVDSHLGAEHGRSTHTTCDISCLGCGHSVHDMCPNTLLPRDMLPAQPTIPDALVTPRQGHRHSLLRPPRSSLLPTA